MKGHLLATLAFTSCLAFAGQSIAQLGIPEDNALNYSITLGAAFPVSGSVDQQANPLVGIAWYDQAGEAIGGGNGAIGVTGDWTQIHRQVDGKDVSLVPVMVSYRQYGQISSWRVFTNFGIGLLATTDSIPEMKLSDGANFGWTAGFGVDLTNNMFFQFRFLAGSNPSDDGLWSAQAGYRF